MTAPRDPDQLVRAFLADGRTELPAESYDAVRSHIERTRQRAVFGPWREPRMSNVTKIAMAAAAVVVAVVVGLNLLPGGSPFGGRASPSPVPSPTPGPSPASLPAGPVTAGTYVTRPFLAPDISIAFTMAVPDGWEAGGPGPGRGPVGLFPTTGAGFVGPTGMSLGFLTVTRLESDPCHWSDGLDTAVGPAVDDLVTAIAANPGYDSSEPAAVSLGGYDGQRIDIQLPAGLDLSTCDDAQFWVWAGGDGQTIYSQGADGRFHLWILDVEGHRVIVMTHDFPGTSQADLAELQSIVDSIRIDVVP
jgi:hypothetical protein